MRKSFVYAAGLMCLALSITDCQKELVDQTTPASEPNFELFAQPVTTKTANNGLDTRWVAEDAINVFHAEAGSTAYDSDGRFTVKDIETGRFDGTVSTSLSADKSYDWYAFYPYSSYNKTPAGISKDTFGYTTIGGTSQTQTGNGSRAHLAGESCPLYGIASNVASDKVLSIEMNHLTSVIKVSVTNNSGEDLTVSSVSFTGTEDIVGTYFINFAASPVSYKSSGNAYVSSTASLTVSNGEALANGSSADFYIALKPFTAKTGSTLKLAVNGYEKTLTIKNDITFTAGHIKPLNFNYDKKAENYSGTYLILNSDKTKVCSSFIVGNNNIKADDYAADNVKDSWVMTIDKVSGEEMYTIKDANGMYLSTGAKKNGNYLVGLKSADTFRSYWAISSVDDGTFTIIATKSSYRNILRYNSQNSLFACYSSGQDAITLVKYVVLPSLAKPVIKADVNTTKDGIDVIWSDVENATKYVVSCTGQENVEVATGVEIASFTGLTIGQEYAVTVTAMADGYKSATSDEAKITIPDPRTPLATPKVLTEVQNVNSVYASWGEIAGAKDYTITCGEQTFTTADTKYTFTNLAYSTEYTVSVVANPSDETVNTPSAAGKSEVVKTGANPEGGTVVTYQHIFTSKPKIGSNVELSNVSWTINATNLNGYNSTSYAGVQFGTSSKDGEIKLTSSSAWTYKSATKIKEIRLWLNLGGTSVTPAVTIGGETAVSDGTKVVKNKDAVKDWTKTTKVTFTPAANGNEGIVVIDVKSVKAGYICAIEIDCM